MYTAELCPTCKEDSNLKLNLVTEIKVQKEDILKKIEETHDATIKLPCPNPDCDNENLTYYTRETRSADESISLYVKCNVCGTKKKIDE